jgi:hypothetical protein
MIDITKIFPARAFCLVAGVVLAVKAVLGCSRAGSESTEPAPQITSTETASEPVGVLRQAQVAAKAIGDACNESDGWSPEPISQPAGGTDPVAIPVPPGYLDYPELSAGVGYCLRKSSVYPYGYYTMNCSSDADCPLPARCDDTLCRAPCTKDADCASPMTCRPVTDANRIRYCMDSAAWLRGMQP